MDLFDRKVMGWALSKTMAIADTVLSAWRMAVINRPITRPLIFHSDRGVQYASREFTEALKEKPVTQSMIRKGDCWDNAVAESFFKILKSELIIHCRYTNHLHVKNNVFDSLKFAIIEKGGIPIWDI